MTKNIHRAQSSWLRSHAVLTRKCMLKSRFRSPIQRTMGMSSVAGSSKPSAVVPQHRLKPW